MITKIVFTYADLLAAFALEIGSAKRLERKAQEGDKPRKQQAQ